MNLIVSLTICFVLVTVGWILALLPTVSEHRARFLFGIIGFASVFLGLRVLGETGMLTLPVSDVNVALADLVVAALYLASLLFLRSETTSHQIARVQLRLSQAAEPPVAQLDTDSRRDARTGSGPVQKHLPRRGGGEDARPADSGEPGGHHRAGRDRQGVHLQ